MNDNTQEYFARTFAKTALLSTHMAAAVAACVDVPRCSGAV